MAQHSLLVEALFAAGEAPPPGGARLAALLHDAPEYVIGDMISPFKAAIGGDYKRIEARLKRAILIRFGLPAEPPDDLERRIKAADRASAYLEATALAGFSVAEARKLFGEPDAADPGFRRLSRADAPGRRRSAVSRPFRRTRRRGRDDLIRRRRRNRSMPRLHVCSLALIAETVSRTGARSLVTLLSPGTEIERPIEIMPERHLYLAVSDIVEPTPGQVLAEGAHLDGLLGFVHAWDRAAPMLIHCFAGVSRSTAAAYIAACALKPDRDEFAIARALRAASPTASPNARLVALADNALGRRGRMSEAIAAIGRGDACFEGAPFTLELD